MSFIFIAVVSISSLYHYNNANGGGARGGGWHSGIYTAIYLKKERGGAEQGRLQVVIFAEGANHQSDGQISLFGGERCESIMSAI